MQFNSSKYIAGCIQFESITFILISCCCWCWVNCL